MASLVTVQIIPSRPVKCAGSNGSDTHVPSEASPLAEPIRLWTSSTSADKYETIVGCCIVRSPIRLRRRQLLVRGYHRFQFPYAIVHRLNHPHDGQFKTRHALD